MTIALTILGLWCIAAATAATGFVLYRHGSVVAGGVDLLFSLAGIGVCMLLLAQVLA